MTTIYCFITLALQEALRSRFFLLFGALFLVALLVSGILADISLTDTLNTQKSIVAGFMRLSVVLSLALFTISSMAREQHDNTLQLYMSLPISRAHFVFAKFIAYLSVAAIVIALTTLVMALLMPNAALPVWGMSLFCEAAIVIAFSLLCILSLQQIPQTFMFVCGFYVLCRSLDQLLLISAKPAIADGSLAQAIPQAMLDTLALLLPNLADFTKTEWLVYSFDASALVLLIAQTLLYCALLCFAAQFDFYRKSL